MSNPNGLKNIPNIRNFTDAFPKKIFLQVVFTISIFHVVMFTFYAPTNNVSNIDKYISNEIN